MRKLGIIALLAIAVAVGGCTLPQGGTVATTESPYFASNTCSSSYGPYGCGLTPVYDTVLICSVFGGPISVTGLDGTGIITAKLTTQGGDLLLEDSISEGETVEAVRPLDPAECVTSSLSALSTLKARIDF